MRILLVAVALTLPLTALATRCPAPAGAQEGLSETEAEVRLKFIRDHLSRERSRLSVWTGAWGGTYGVLAMGQMVAASVVKESDRVDYFVGAGATLVGLASVVVTPPKALADQPALESRLAATTDVCAALADAEKTLAADADGLAFGTSWVMHTASIVYNLAVGALLGFGFHHWQSGAINAVVGAALGEAMIFSQPTGLIDAWSQYKKGQLQSPQASSWHLNIGASGGPAGVGISARVTF